MLLSLWEEIGYGFGSCHKWKRFRNHSLALMDCNQKTTTHTQFYLVRFNCLCSYKRCKTNYSLHQIRWTRTGRLDLVRGCGGNHLPYGVNKVLSPWIQRPCLPSRFRAPLVPSVALPLSSPFLLGPSSMIAILTACLLHDRHTCFLLGSGQQEDNTSGITGGW